MKKIIACIFLIFLFTTFVWATTYQWNDDYPDPYSQSITGAFNGSQGNFMTLKDILNNFLGSYSAPTWTPGWSDGLQGDPDTDGDNADDIEIGVYINGTWYPLNNFLDEDHNEYGKTEIDSGTSLPSASGLNDGRLYWDSDDHVLYLVSNEQWYNAASVLGAVSSIRKTGEASGLSGDVNIGSPTGTISINQDSIDNEIELEISSTAFMQTGKARSVNIQSVSSNPDYPVYQEFVGTDNYGVQVIWFDDCTDAATRPRAHWSWEIPEDLDTTQPINVYYWFTYRDAISGGDDTVYMALTWKDLDNGEDLTTNSPTNYSFKYIDLGTIGATVNYGYSSHDNSVDFTIPSGKYAAGDVLNLTISRAGEDPSDTFPDEFGIFNIKMVYTCKNPA